MPRRRRQGRIPTPAWERPRGAIGRRILGRSFQFYGSLAIAALFVVSVVIVGYAFLSNYIEKQRRPGSTAIAVAEKQFRLDYFSNRLKMYVGPTGGQDAQPAQQLSALNAVSEQIINEELVRNFAKDLEVSATEEEVNSSLASRLGIKVGDANFDIVFHQELARTGLSEQDYRDMVLATVLLDKVRTELASQLPASAESVRYRQILVSTEETAQQVRDELEGGADFAALAKEKSLDTNTKDKGGEVGWTPRDILEASVEELVFALKVGERTVIPSSSGVYVMEMEEKADDRPIDDAQKPALTNRAVAKWLQEKRDSVKVVNNMTVDGGDREKITWALERAYRS